MKEEDDTVVAQREADEEEMNVDSEETNETLVEKDLSMESFFSSVSEIPWQRHIVIQCV